MDNIDFQNELKAIDITKDQIRKQSPEFLVDKIEQIADLFKNRIIATRDICQHESKKFLADDNLKNPALLSWEVNRQNIEIDYGKWSHNFNRILWERISENDKAKTAQALAKAKKFNLAYLFWHKVRDYILTYNTLQIFRVMDKLRELQIIQETIKKRIGEVKVSDYNAAAAAYKNKEK